MSFLGDCLLSVIKPTIGATIIGASVVIVCTAVNRGTAAFMHTEAWEGDTPKILQYTDAFNFPKIKELIVRKRNQRLQDQKNLEQTVQDINRKINIICQRLEIQEPEHIDVCVGTGIE